VTSLTGDRGDDRHTLSRARVECIDAAGAAPDLTGLGRRARATLDAGAYGVLLRGAIGSAEDFRGLRDALLPGIAPYLEAATPRTPLGGGVYTSTDFPPGESIFLHNENSSAQVWPAYLVLGCLRAPQEGGCTPLADVGGVFRRLRPEVVARFDDLGWLLVRNFYPGFGVGTAEEVDAYGDRAEITRRWLGPERLQTRQRREAFMRHPRLGHVLWFNHVAFWHPSRLGAEVRGMLVDEFGPDGLPFDTRYGDGTVIPDEVIAEVVAAYDAETVRFTWCDGDVLVLDNMSLAHGRDPYAGERRVIVSMGATWARSACRVGPGELIAQPRRGR
jgi:hypothetical protein